jgi:hypothetical protein
VSNSIVEVFSKLKKIAKGVVFISILFIYIKYIFHYDPQLSQHFFSSLSLIFHNASNFEQYFFLFKKLTHHISILSSLKHILINKKYFRIIQKRIVK